MRASKRLAVLVTAAVPLVSMTALGGLGTTAQAAKKQAPKTTWVSPPTTVYGDMTATDRTIMENQSVLVPYAGKLTRGLPEGERHHLPGFGGLRLHPLEKRITLYWKGTIPDDVQATLASPPLGVTVTVTSAPYNRAELKAARTKLVSDSGQTNTSLSADGAKIQRIAPLPDGSGLMVGYTSATTGGGGCSTGGDLTMSGGFAAGGFLAATCYDGGGGETTATVTEAELEEAAGVPVTSTFEGASTTTGRQNDTSAWDGGAALRSPTGKYCTSGFPATRNSDGRHMMITAAHCSNYGPGTWRDGPKAESLGWTSQLSPQRDTAVIQMASGQYTSRHIWTGGPLETSYSLGVSGYAANFTDQRVCTSGASTGLHCGLVITHDEASNWTADGVWHFPMIVAQRAGVAVGSGDSGGPVFEMKSDGTILARGIISSGNTATTCPSVTAVAASCFKTVNYAPISVALKEYGLTLRTVQ